MIRLSNPSLVKVRGYAMFTTPQRHNVRVGTQQALPVKIIRVTVEKMMRRIIHISQPNHYWHGHYTDMYCVGVEDNDDSTIVVAITCVLLIVILYIILVLLRKYEKENEKE